MSTQLRVLQVEDSESDAAMLVRALEKGGYEVRSRRVESPAAMREALEQQDWDVIISDYHLPGFDAPAALQLAQEMGCDTPFLVVSGVIGEEVAVGMMKAGAHDYLIKSNLARLAPAVEREIREWRNRRQLADQRHVLDRQSHLLNLSRDAIITANATRVIETWNLGAEETYGWAKHEAVGKVLHDLIETRPEATAEEIDSDLHRKGHWEGVLIQSRRDGRRIVIESRQALVRDTTGLPLGILEINRNATDRKRLEERLREAHKAETMGNLAAGLAHNFNNLLTVVLGNTQLALLEPGHTPHVKELLAGAMESALTAANLTRQILAYAGKGAFVKVPTSVSGVAEDTVQILKASSPERIALQTELAGDLPEVLIDPRQLQQVLTNLILNAAESIDRAQGGTVLVRTDSKDAYVQVEVCDSGAGMDEKTRNRVFDPFFTTKEFGRGLGLSAAQGIVRSLGGEIQIASTLGLGTCVKVLLPAAQSPVHPPN